MTDNHLCMGSAYPSAGCLEIRSADGKDEVTGGAGGVVFVILRVTTNNKESSVRGPWQRLSAPGRRDGAWEPPRCGPVPRRHDPVS